jgi:hypothetical protein
MKAIKTSYFIAEYVLHKTEIRFFDLRWHRHKANHRLVIITLPKSIHKVANVGYFMYIFPTYSAISEQH